jgi:hypothetical protein
MGTLAERDHYGTYRLYAGRSVGPLARAREREREREVLLPGLTVCQGQPGHLLLLRPVRGVLAFIMACGLLCSFQDL